MNERHGADEHLDDDREPIDPDIALTVDYLAGELPPDGEAAFRKRLVDDAAFFDKVEPVVVIWQMQWDLRAELARLTEEGAGAATVTRPQPPAIPAPPASPEPRSAKPKL
jgi:hypothetical protein